MTISYALSNVVLPPVSPIIATLVGVALLRRHRTIAVALIVASQLVLLILSVPVVAATIARTLEPPPLDASQLASAQAIVILGGGRNLGAPEWGGETLNSYSLQRIRYGARLARDTRLPIYVTGGRPGSGLEPEGTLMRDALTREFGVPVRWVDSAADTTQENAAMAARDLLPAGVQRVVLVTDALHMPRSIFAMRSVGFEVIAAPTGYRGQAPFTPYQLVPGIGAMRLSHLALREWVSQAYYRLRNLVQ